MPISQSQAGQLGHRYIAAWNSHDPNAVAAFFADDGRIVINDGEPCAGRAAVAEMAQGFFTAFPDLVVHLDGMRTSGTHCVLLWSLEGTNAGPDGTGARVGISGWEYWRMGDDGLVAESRGHYDAEDYARQLAGG